MVSLQKAVALNPRNFQAAEQLAEMLEEYGDKAGALKSTARRKRSIRNSKACNATSTRCRAMSRARGFNQRRMANKE